MIATHHYSGASLAAPAAGGKGLDERLQRFLLDHINDRLLHHFPEGPEDLFDRITAFGTALHVGEAGLLGQFRSLLISDLPLVLQVHFVANDHDLGWVSDSLGEILDPVALIVGGVRTEWNESLESMLKTMSTP